MKKQIKKFICKNCLNDFIPSGHSKGLFCSRSCAAIINNQNRKIEDIEKQRKSLLLTNLLKRYNKPTISCKICGCRFCPLKPKMRVCSLECRTISKQRTAKNISKEKRKEIGSLGGKASAKVNVKRSKDEIKLYKLCKKYFNNVKHNKILIDGWDADIVLEKEKIAILWNGPWHYKQMKHKNHSLKQVQNRDQIKIDLFTKKGWNVLIFEDRYYTPVSAFEKIKECVR